MFVLKPKIVIGDFVYPFVSEVKIVSDWDSLTDTAEVTFPRKINEKGKTINDLVKVGDPIEIYGNYQGFNEYSRFSGFVTDVSPSLPIRIKCQDAMYLAKQFTMTKTFKSVKLSELVEYVFQSSGGLLDGYGYDFKADIDLGKFRINRATGAQVFEELKKKYGIYSYVLDNNFSFGFTYSELFTPPKKFTFEENIISDNLVFKREEDIRLKAKAVSIDSNNNKIEVSVGDPDGEQRTLHYYGLNEAALKEIAQADLEKLKYTGFKGDFTTFLHPFIQHSQTIEIESLKLPERNGRYYVAKVVTSFGSGGGRQTITLDRVSAQTQITEI